MFSRIRRAFYLDEAMFSFNFIISTAIMNLTYNQIAKIDSSLLGN